MLLFLFLNCCLIVLNSCSYCTNSQFYYCTELVIPIGIPSKEAKPEIEIHPIIPEAKKESVLYNLWLYNPGCFMSSRK